MAKFQPGELPPVGQQISEDSAREMQLRSAASRKRNRTLRETLLAALQEDGGEGMTKMEILVRQAMNNHKKGKLTFHDLKDLAFVLGEAELGITGGDGGDNDCRRATWPQVFYDGIRPALLRHHPRTLGETDRADRNEIIDSRRGYKLLCE